MDCKVAGGSLQADKETSVGATVEGRTKDSRAVIQLLNKAILSNKQFYILQLRKFCQQAHLFP